MDVVQTRFLPEFLNRIDDILLFRPLTPQDTHKIVGFQVERLRKQLRERNLELEVTEAAINAIALEGYDPVYGARPLKRVIQQRIQNPLAVELLKGDFPEGSRVRVDYADGDFGFERMEAAAVA